MPLVNKVSAILFAGVLSAAVKAQSPILGFSTTYVSTSSSVSGYNNRPAPNSGSFNGCNGNSFAYGFNKGTDNALKLLSIVANNKNYFIANNAAARVVLRRVNNANVTGSRTIVSFESATGGAAACPSGSKVDIRLPYQDAMENFLNNNYINQGTDNIFTNTDNGDGNNNNIERVDILFPSGLSSSNTTDAGFAIFDRGTNNGHDGFRIVAVTSLNANGDPASFGSVKTITKGNGNNNGSWGHPTPANGNQTLSFYVMRKEGSESQLRASAAVNGQQIGGVFFSFADLGIAPGQIIYGYSVLAADGMSNPTSAQLLNINNTAVYPTNTTENSGGLDMMAVNAIFSTGGHPLAATETLLKGSVSSGRTVLNWQALNLLPDTKLALERSENGVDYRMVYAVPVADLMAQGSYAENGSGTYYYRLKIQSAGRVPYYSNVVKTGAKPKSVLVYPNLVKENEQIVVEGLADGLYKLRFTTAEGRVYSADLSMQGGRGKMTQPLPPSLKGIVWLTVIDNHGASYSAGKIVFQ